MKNIFYCLRLNCNYFCHVHFLIKHKNTSQALHTYYVFVLVTKTLLNSSYINEGTKGPFYDRLYISRWILWKDEVMYVVNFVLTATVVHKLLSHSLRDSKWQSWNLNKVFLISNKCTNHYPIIPPTLFAISYVFWPNF